MSGHPYHRPNVSHGPPLRSKYPYGRLAFAHRGQGFESFTGGLRTQKEPTIYNQAKINLLHARGLIRRYLCNYNGPLPLVVNALRDPESVDDVRKIAMGYPVLETKLELLLRAETLARAVQPDHSSLLQQDRDYRFSRQIWDVASAHPWMHIKCDIARVTFNQGQYDTAIAMFSELLSWNLADRMGMRFTFGPLLLHVRRNADALSFSLAWINGLHSPLHGGTSFVSPANLSLRQELVELPYHRPQDIDAVLEAEHFYTAAFAACMWGDCELARQCLRLGTIANPMIMLRILGGSATPRLVDRTHHLEFETFNLSEDYQPGAYHPFGYSGI